MANQLVFITDGMQSCSVSNHYPTFYFNNFLERKGDRHEMTKIQKYVQMLRKCLEVFRKNNDLKLLEKNLEMAINVFKK